MIAASERPMIYYGGGVETSDAGNMLLQLQRKADIPSAHTMMAIGCIPDTEPLSLGMIGMHGTVSAAWAVERCDLLVCIGCPLLRPRCDQYQAFCTVGEGYPR